MSALRLTLKLEQRVDCSPLTPDQLAGKSLAEIRQLLLWVDGVQLPLETVFQVSGHDTQVVQFDGNTGLLDFIGHAMCDGSVVVCGDAGWYAGLAMAGGVMTIKGNAWHYLGTEMTGGRIVVQGNAGDWVGAALPGNLAGMRGGLILVQGNIGDRAGDQMRRGMLLVEGNAGSYGASRMVAGTIAVLGHTAEYWGYAMRRGTVLLQQMPSLHATMNDSGTHTLPFLQLLYQHFRTLPGRFAALRGTRVRMFSGDLANQGKGEILVLQRV